MSRPIVALAADMFTRGGCAGRVLYGVADPQALALWSFRVRLMQNVRSGIIDIQRTSGRPGRAETPTIRTGRHLAALPSKQ